MTTTKKKIRKNLERDIPVFVSTPFLEKDVNEIEDGATDVDGTFPKGQRSSSIEAAVDFVATLWALSSSSSSKKKGRYNKPPVPGMKLLKDDDDGLLSKCCYETHNMLDEIESLASQLTSPEEDFLPRCNSNMIKT